MKERFWLKSVVVHTSPGFESGTFPPVQELGEHLNVIWGPNAVGKSTLTRAMRSLIWKGKERNGVEASGRLESLASPWDLSLSHGRLHQIRLSDDQELMLPGRNDELSESYWFTLHELLQENSGRSDTFLREVRTRMQGGVDLDVAMERAGGIPAFSRITASQAKSAKDALEHLKSIIKKQEEHQYIQDDIRRLQDETNMGPVLERKKATLLSAQELLTIQERIDALEQQLALYDPAIGSITKGSPQRLEEIKASKRKAEELLERYIRQKHELTLAYKGCSVEEHHLKDVDKPLRIQKKLAAHIHATNTHTTSSAAFFQAEASLQEWEEEHSWIMSDPPKEDTLKTYIEKLKQLASECEPLRCKVDASKSLEEALGDYEQIKISAKELSVLHFRLSDWISLFWKLEGTQEKKPVKEGTKKWVLISLALSGIFSSALGIIVHPLFFIAGFLGMLGLVALLVPSSGANPLYKQREGELQESREELEQLFIRMGMEGPKEWSVTACQELGLSLGESIAVVQQREILNQRRKRAKESLAASQEKLTHWYNDWKDAALAIGLQDDEARLEGAQFFHFAQRLDKWSMHRLTYEQTNKKLLLDQGACERTLLTLQDELETKQSDLPSLEALGESLVRRLERAASLRVDLASNAIQISSAREELNGCDKALEQFWQERGLPFGSEETLKSLATHVEAWEGLQRDLQYSQAQFARRSEEDPEALALANTCTKALLDGKIEHIEKEQELLKTKLKSLGGLIQTYENLKFGSELSQAELAHTQAQQALEAFRQEQVMSRMITLLASDLKEESKTLYEPQVLKHASTWLGSITENRYTLSANQEGFFATDTTMAKNYKLDELSSATRVQLLFSIRMAFISMQEESSNVSLPIFLDELLANSDDQRAAAIVQAIGRIALDRQVFYVTAQRDEVEKLMTLGSIPVNVIALENLKRDFRVSKTPLKPYIFERVQIPQPLGSYHEYAKALAVAGPSLWEPLEGLHIWHLCAETLQVYGYLKQGFTHIGQLMQALGPESPLHKRLKILVAAQKLAQEGRCRLLDASSLEGAPAPLSRSTNYWSQMLEFVGSGALTGNDLLHLIESKTIKNVSTSNLEILTDWLLEERFASEKEPRSLEDILNTLFVMFDTFMVASDDEEVVHRYLTAVVRQ